MTGSAKGADGYTHAVRWTLTNPGTGWQVQGLPQQLDTSGRAISGYGRGINSTGETVGYAPNAKNGLTDAVRWAGTGTTGEILPGSSASSSAKAYDVNGLGVIVGDANGRAVLSKK